MRDAALDGATRDGPNDVDGGSSMDAAVGIDGGSSMDAAVGIDGGSSMDAAVGIDSSVGTDSGGAPDAGVSLDAGPGSNVVFVTPPVLTGNLGGLTGADATCASYASSAGLPGTFVAYLSDATTAAADRLGSAEGWVRPDGLPVAQTKADLLANALIYPPSIGPDGTPISPNSGNEHLVFTGTQFDGTAAAATSRCSDWTSATASSSVEGGEASAGGRRWQSGTFFDCSFPSSIYCFQIDHTVPLSPFAPTAGRIVFARLWSPSLGTTPDAACAGTATSAGLAGTYHAFVAFQTATAASRFMLTRWPWVRPDGAIVFESMTDLRSGVALAPVTVGADGSPVANLYYWSGALDPFSLAGSNCNDWTVTTGGSLYGHGQYANLDWFSWGGSATIPCNGYGVLYCLQD